MVVIEQHFHFGGADPERLDRIEAKLDAVLATTTRTDEGVSDLMTIAQDIADAVREDADLDSAILTALDTATTRIEELIIQAEETGSLDELRAGLADLRANNEVVRAAITQSTPADPETPTDPAPPVDVPTEPVPPVEPEVPSEPSVEPVPETPVEPEPGAPIEPDAEVNETQEPTPDVRDI